MNRKVLYRNIIKYYYCFKNKAIIICCFILNILCTFLALLRVLCILSQFCVQVCFLWRELLPFVRLDSSTCWWKIKGFSQFFKLRSGHLELPNHVRTYAYIWITVPSSRKALHDILVFLYLVVKVSFTPVCRANSNITYFESWNYNKSNNYMYLCHVSYQILPALLSKAYSYALAWENTNLFLFGSQIGHWRGVTNRRENIRLLKLHISSSLLPVTLRFAGISHPCGRSVTVFTDYIAKNRIMSAFDFPWFSM